MIVKHKHGNGVWRGMVGRIIDLLTGIPIIILKHKSIYDLIKNLLNHVLVIIQTD